MINISDELSTKIQKSLNEQIYEVESRFGFFKDGNFTPTISVMNYQNIKKHFSTDEFEIVNTKTKVESNNGARKTIHNDSFKTEKKTLIYNEDFIEYGIRISVHKETEVDVSSIKIDSKFERKKDRLSFLSKNKTSKWYNWRIDLTIVLESFNGKQKNQKYELELEKIGNNSVTTEDFFFLINDLLCISQNTEYILSYRQIHHIKYLWNKFIPAALGLHNEHYFHEYISRARDITLEDMMNPKYINESVITAKLDGMRKFLFVKDEEIYEIFPPLDIRCIYSITKKIQNNSNIHILDVEKIDDKYYPFDILVYENNTILTKSFSERLKCLEKVVKNIKFLEMLDLIDGETYIGPVTQNYMFSDIARKCLETMKKKNIPNDGLIIQPLWAKYINQPPINLKWKPSDQLNIDFLLVSTENKEEYELYYYEMNILKKFSGTKIYPYEKTVYFKNGQFENTLIEGAIVEFCFRDGNFVPLRVRRDKTRPNGKITIFNLWHLIQNPVSEKVLTCQNKKVANHIWQIDFANYLSEKYQHIGVDYKWKYFSWNFYNQLYQKNKNINILVEDSAEELFKMGEKMLGYKPKLTTRHIFALSTPKMSQAIVSDKIIYDMSKVDYPHLILYHEKIEFSMEEIEIVDAYVCSTKNDLLLSLQSQTYIKGKMFQGYQFSMKNLLESDIQKYPTLGNDTYLITQPGTGSCFYHGILYSLYQEYKDNSDKLDMVAKFRKKMALTVNEHPEWITKDMMTHIIETLKIEYHSKTTAKIYGWTREKILEEAKNSKVDIPDKILEEAHTKNFKEKLFLVWGCTELEQITGTSINWKEMAIKKMIQDLQTVTTYANEGTLFLVENFLNINILVIDKETNKLMSRKEAYKESRPSIVMIIVKDLHYDLLGFKENDSIRMLFKHEHPFLVKLRNI